MSNLKEDVQDAVIDAGALQRPHQQNIQVALHEIDPDVIAAAPDLTQDHRILTIVDPDRKVVVAQAYVHRDDAGDLIEGIIRHVKPKSQVNFDFCQNAPLTESCRRYLDAADVYVTEREVPNRPWPSGSGAPTSPMARFAEQMNGGADPFSVETARDLMSDIRRAAEDEAERRAMLE